MSVSVIKSLVSRSARLKAVASYVRFGRETRARFLGNSRRDETGPMLFTNQKCASTFVSQAFALVAREYGRSVYNFAGLYWNTGERDVYGALQRDADRLFTQPDALYGPLRSYVEVPGMERRPIVLMLRDPRDVLVSAYYSIAYSHSLPGGAKAREEYEARRSRVQEMDIEQFVTDPAGLEFLSDYRTYADKLLGQPNVTFLTYEDLIADPTAWSQRFLKGLGLEHRAGMADAIAAIYEHGKPTSGENRVNQHRRSGEAGQFSKALKPQTIERLDALLSDDFAQYGCWRSS